MCLMVVTEGYSVLCVWSCVDVQPWFDAPADQVGAPWHMCGCDMHVNAAAVCCIQPPLRLHGLLNIAHWLYLLCYVWITGLQAPACEAFQSAALLWGFHVPFHGASRVHTLCVQNARGFVPHLGLLTCGCWRGQCLAAHIVLRIVCSVA